MLRHIFIFKNIFFVLYSYARASKREWMHVKLRYNIFPI